ncbi:hypothetical protein A4U64_03660 [Rhodococcus sp. WB1]|nr:hypothetical protein [Rhodococcus aetherivorans]ANZ23890.1 hypothetical protein A4U64_03660 [Rhodococcus sp. WB1]
MDRQVLPLRIEVFVKRLLAGILGCAAITVAVPATASADTGSTDLLPYVLPAALCALTSGSSQCALVPLPTSGAVIGAAESTRLTVAE